MIEKYSVFIILILSGILPAFTQNLQTGDLLFQIKGSSDFSNAISSATYECNDIDFAHVAILYVLEGNNWVIEAEPKNGVRIVSYEDFLLNSPKVGDKPGVVVKRLAFDFPIYDTIINASKFLDQPYDWWYLPDNGKIYCSELIYECYKYADGTHIFSTQPMNFRNKDGSMPEFWENLYKSLGVPVPEGIPGTNPNDLSKSDSLIEVYRFF